MKKTKMRGEYLAPAKEEISDDYFLLVCILRL